LKQSKACAIRGTLLSKACAKSIRLRLKVGDPKACS
jgi:hypothetical protein